MAKVAASFKELEDYIGQTGLYKVVAYSSKNYTKRGDEVTLYCPVKILDAKRVWGRLRFLITPINGKGQKWAQSALVTLKD